MNPVREPSWAGNTTNLADKWKAYHKFNMQV